MDGRAPPPPPPPPPHGSAPPPPKFGTQTGGLPQGNYDIFVIPPHASGGGFLYLPSLQCHRNSFLAGVACTLTVVGIWSLIAPWVRYVTTTVVTSSGLAIVMVMIGLAGMAFYLGSKQNEPMPRGQEPGASSSSSQQQQHQHQQQQQQQHSYTPGAGPTPSWQRPNTTSSGTSGWEKAREEMKKKEEERKRREELEKKAKEKADKERWDQAAARAKELREKIAREEEARKKAQKEKEDRERREREARSKASAASPSHAPKTYQKPSASSYMGDDDGYSFRPYDTPNPKRAEKVNSQGSFFSESSYAPSHSTARTTPPPSHRGPYTNKDPDKVTIKAVYAFTDLFAKPVAQLVSGQGSVTDGLVLKMTTEGLFIDDDIRGVPQREWDVRAWTMKLVEVYCPCFTARFASASSASVHASSSRFSMRKEKDPIVRFLSASAAASSGPPSLSQEETEHVLAEFLGVCRADCASASSARHSQRNTNTAASEQNGDFQSLHVLRACVRDAENKKYVFVIDESEAWKVAVGLQRLRKGSQVRSLGVSSMSMNETRTILASLGW